MPRVGNRLMTDKFFGAVYTRFTVKATVFLLSDGRHQGLALPSGKKRRRK
jgi:hypothetical protein